MRNTRSETGKASTFSQDLSNNRDRYALDWVRLMRFTAPTIGLAAALGGLVALTLGAGCAGKTPGVNASSANVSATASASDAPQPSALQVTSPPTQPSAYVPPGPPLAPEPVITQAPATAGSAATDGSTGGSTSYTVQHGDTLFAIAKQHYGDGKQWKRIASANPGLTPAKLKVGQKIVLP